MEQTLQLVGLIADLSMAALVSVLFVIVWRSRDQNEARSDGLLEQALKLFAGLNEVITASTEAIKALTQEVRDDQALTARVHRDMQTEHSKQRITLDALSQLTASVSATMDEAKATMRDISARRDQQHAQVMAELQPISTRLDDILRHITITTDENTLRHEVSKAVLLLNEVLTILKKPKTDGVSAAAEVARKAELEKPPDDPTSDPATNQPEMSEEKSNGT